MGITKADWADLIEFLYEKDFERRNPGHMFYNTNIFSVQDTEDSIVKQSVKKAEEFFGGISNANIRWHEKQIALEQAGRQGKQ